MDDKEQAAIDALRAAGLEAEALAVEILRGQYKALMYQFQAGQRDSYKNGQRDERERCAKVCEGMCDEDRPGDYAWAIRTEWAAETS